MAIISSSLTALLNWNRFGPTLLHLFPTRITSSAPTCWSPWCSAWRTLACPASAAPPSRTWSTLSTGGRSSSPGRGWQRCARRRMRWVGIRKKSSVVDRTRNCNVRIIRPYSREFCRNSTEASIVWFIIIHFFLHLYLHLDIILIINFVLSFCRSMRPPAFLGVVSFSYFLFRHPRPG